MSHQQVKTEFRGALSTQELEQWRRLTARAYRLNAAGSADPQVYEDYMIAYHTFVGEIMEKLDFTSDDSFSIAPSDGRVWVAEKPPSD